MRLRRLLPHALLAGIWLFAGFRAHSVADEPIAVSDDYLLTKWDQDDGLPDNNVSALQQTRDGFLWIGTYGGLARFDGLHFVAFDGRVSGLPGGKIRCLSEDHEGALWVGLEKAGVIQYRGGVFTAALPPSDKPDDWLTSLACDSEGRIWAGLSRMRAIFWESKRWIPFGPSAGLAGEGSVTCAADASGKIWLTTDNSYGFVEGGKAVTLAADVAFPQLLPRKAGGFWLLRGNVLLIRNEQQQLLYGVEAPWRGGSTEVQALFEDAEGALWIGTKGQGLFRFDGEFARIPTSHNYILSIAEDREGNRWVGTLGGGLLRLHPRQVRLHDQGNGLPADVIDSVCEDGAGGLWFGARNVGAIRLLAGKYTAFTAENGWPGGYLTTVCPDGAGGVWFGTLTDGLIHWSAGAFAKSGSIKGEPIQCLLQDRTGVLWVATPRGLSQWRNGILTRLPPEADLAGIAAMAEDSTGNLWAGTQSGLLFRFDGSQWKRLGPGPNLPAAAIRTILAESADTLWLGTHAGLIRDAHGSFSRLTQAQGLPNDDIRQILPGDNGSIWLGSARGLLRVRQTDLDAVCDGRKSVLDCTTFGRADGLGSIEFAEGYGHGACRSSDGRLWFATLRGVVEANPADLAPSPEPPPVHIEEVVADGARLAPPLSGRTLIPALTREIEIRYTAIDLTAPENVRFRYRLGPEDRDWTEVGGSRVAAFLGVSPGSHRFEISAARGGDPANPSSVAALEIFVQPALWQRTSIRLAGSLALLALAAGAIRFWTLRRIRVRLRALEHEQALENERSRIARDMHDELGASLTRIALLGEQLRARASALPAADAERIDKISNAARAVSQTLDEIVWTVDPGNDSVEGLIGYIAEYAAEYLAAAGVPSKLDLPEEAPALPMSSEVRHQLLLVVKEALNNAVKFSAAQEIRVRVWFEAQSLRLQIADDGQGFHPGQIAKSGHGLANMRQRLLAAGGHCEIASEPGAGVRVEVTLPLPNAAP